MPSESSSRPQLPFQGFFSSASLNQGWLWLPRQSSVGQATVCISQLRPRGLICNGQRFFLLGVWDVERSKNRRKQRAWGREESLVEVEAVECEEAVNTPAVVRIEGAGRGWQSSGWLLSKGDSKSWVEGIKLLIVSWKSIFQFSMRSNWAATVGVSSLAGLSMYPHGRSSFAEAVSIYVSSLPPGQAQQIHTWIRRPASWPAASLKQGFSLAVPQEHPGGPPLLKHSPFGIPVGSWD